MSTPPTISTSRDTTRITSQSGIWPAWPSVMKTETSRTLSAMAPILISKANTVAQLVLAGVVLADIGLGIVAPGIVPALVLLVAVTTVASGGAYLIGWGRGLIGS